jgi:hypothetical protein
MRRAGIIAVALIALAGCAGVESAGRNAEPEALPPPVENAPAPAGPVAAPNVSIPIPAPARPANADEEGDVVVRGQVRNQVPAPAGDPRTTSERIRDIRAWDQCVTSAQGALGSDAMSPQLDTPEDLCRAQLGMASRTALPTSRRR